MEPNLDDFMQQFDEADTKDQLKVILRWNEHEFTKREVAAIQDAINVIAELEQQIVDLSQHVPEWLCEACNKIHPAPTSFSGLICPACGDLLRPTSKHERNLKKQLADLQNKKAVLPSEDYISRFYVDEHTSLDDVIKSIWCDALDANGIKVGE